ncbi:hypothetical protein HII31_12292 [Pseudocercospora fuligena]|uniref:Uncharacterized protein n=1 Tax=Pseudocercospora fuligena TaxID=685502 RepID=A0A8H6R5M4_9PEZI|nr:hypothetical protein HII31_12292 [Pseudocercospora fuligena]
MASPNPLRPQKNNDFYETLKATAMAQVNAAASPNPWDHDALMAIRSAELGYVGTLHPADALPPGLDKSLGLEDFSHVVKSFGPLVERMDIEIKSVVVDVQTRTVVVTLTAIYDLVAVGELEAIKDDRTDYMWLTVMDETGTKIIKMEEFLNADRITRKGGILERSRIWAEQNT